MKYIATIILIMTCFSAFTQNEIFDDLEGEYFYHKTNTTSNYFDKSYYEIDSVFVFKKISNDTITTWTSGVSVPIDEEKLKQLEANNKFNIYFQKGITQRNGKTITHRMKPNYFKIINDTLFEVTYTYSISQDSFQYLNSNKTMSEVIEITDSVSNRIFRPIFSPSFFKDYRTNTYDELTGSCPNKIFLDGVFQTGEGKFYQFHIENKCGTWGHHWGYIIDEKLNIVKYGGYYSKSYKTLNKNNLIFKSKDD